MAEDRRTRERRARRRLIIAAARRLAESEGWDAVTTRRLSVEVEYSQPVLYTHFAGMDEVVAAVAVDGFEELAAALRAARRGSGGGRAALRRAAGAYLDFAEQNAALYEAMFTRGTLLRFAAPETPEPVTVAYGELRRVVAAVAGGRDVDTYAEVVWAGLHGLVTLDRDGRLRPQYRAARLDMLIGVLAGDHPA
ncbi:WHG domain-containing protein [Mycolicibacillus parakoreensis]|uniref:TetR/AcrR family transcriptional regulator n=1 Tax=Mycolicibacillus parakoreensis TaxID=1069221 RepID=A0ABY3TZS5_9MYCO|nr:TetR/AcrR family transcriptional regulator [Mycolicibacillus parakoreensis]MCV7315986.1 WHG domain-containing protein [Mycolicibacillus parakoreensis]ULN52384.1 TetR/AcrR family transcriptional regulator [Mycolicibacillus parakoreensis]HLR98148.1 WHG domain-containing protein [Mycolicibacillus parakoreensis]